MTIERRAVVRTRRAGLLAAFVAWTVLGVLPLAMLAPLALARGGPWAWELLGAFLVYPTVLFALGHAWSWRWRGREQRVHADERGLWIDGRLSWKRDAIRHARLDDAGVLHLQRRVRAITVDLGRDGAAWLRAMRLEPDRSVARFLMQNGASAQGLVVGGMQAAAYATGIALLALGASAAGALVLFGTLAFALVWATRLGARVEVGADGIRIVRHLARARFVRFGAIERVESVGEDVRFVLRTGEVVVVHHSAPTVAKLAIVASPDERRSLVERVSAQVERHRGSESRGDAFARGDRSTAVWLDELARFAEPSTFRTAAVPPDVLWRVVEDTTAPMTARAGAAFALRNDLGGEGRERLRIAADACAAPALRVALDGIAMGDAALGETFERLVDEHAPSAPGRRRSSPLRR